MKLLLDTHVFLGAITGDARLSARHAERFVDDGSDLFLSVASIWEMLTKVGVGRLPMPAPAAEYIVRQMEKNRISLLPIRTAHLAELEKLPPLHRDPFDRLLIAQSRAEGMPLLTVDHGVRQYPADFL